MRILFPSFVTGPGAVALLWLRIVAGSAFVLHGLPKIRDPFGWLGDEVPALLQALAAISEFFGGMAWVAGLLTPIASLGIASTMSFAAFRHFSSGDPFVGKGGYELALVYACVGLVLILLGPGRWSVDHQLFGRK